MLFIYTVYGFLVATEQYEPLVWLLYIVYFTGPAALVSITLMLLLNYDTVPAQVIYQPIVQTQYIIPTAKFL